MRKGRAEAPRYDMQGFEEVFERLKRSAFRRRFRLGVGERAYVQAKGMGTIREHAEAFVRGRLAPAAPRNDGKQTPMRGHPVFVAQHATATCCRGCLEKWWRVSRGRELTETEQAKFVRFLMAWIEREAGGRQGERAAGTPGLLCQPSLEGGTSINDFK